jgi:hypothetical protein
MRKILFLFILLSLFVQRAFSQTAHIPTPLENKMTDSLCDCVSKLDFSKITNKEEAIAAYTDCIGKHTDIFSALAIERKEDIMDQAAMRQLGLVIAKNLMAKNCVSFVKLSMLTVKKDGVVTNSTTGTFKRIDLKGFNYIVLTDNDNQEKSFLWLRQFPGSENYMNGATKFTGKRLKIGWQELEVYLPQAKDYYKIKEIVSISVE